MNRTEQPHSLEAEEYLLSCCLLDEGTEVDKCIREGIRGTHFYSIPNGIIYEELVSMRSEGHENALEILAERLKANGKLDQIGGMRYLLDVTAKVPTTAESGFFRGKVLEMYRRRELIRLANDLIEQSKENRDLNEIHEELNRSLQELQGSAAPSESTKDVVRSCIEWASAAIQGISDHQVRVTTGLDDFDARIGPILPHEYVVIGARTSVGKSSFMAQMAQHNLARGLRVAYFTLETSSRAVLLQMAAQRSGVNLRELQAELRPRQDRFMQEIKHLGEQPVMVFEKDLTLDQIEARARLLNASFHPDVVFIDYLGLIRTAGDKSYERMSKLSKAMIPLRKSLDCALVVAAQLNRGNEQENRAPKRTDFRDSGSLEEDAHRIIAIHRPEKDPDGIVQDLDRTEFYTELLQLKCRDGALANGRAKFLTRSTQFVETRF